MNLIRCSKCGQDKSEEEFYPHFLSDGYLVCKPCWRERQRRWYEENKDRIAELWRKYRITGRKARNDAVYRNRVKFECLSHYGGDPPKCVRCGIEDLRVLTIDHIDGGGAVHRKQLRWAGNYLYVWLRKNGFPPGYQVLCMNCQWIKRYENREVRKLFNGVKLF
jgi:hypothetical protein